MRDHSIKKIHNASSLDAIASMAVRLLAKKEGMQHRFHFQAGKPREQKTTAQQKKRPHFWGHPKEAREGGKVREGDAHRPTNQSRNGDVEMIRRGLKSFG